MRQVKADHTTAALSTIEDGTFTPRNLWGANWSAQLSIDGDGSVSATVTIEVSNDLVHWVTLITASLSGTDTDTEIHTVQSAYAYCRPVVASITGTGATVTVFLAGLAA